MIGLPPPTQKIRIEDPPFEPPNESSSTSGGSPPTLPIEQPKPIVPVAPEPSLPEVGACDINDEWYNTPDLIPPKTDSSRYVDVNISGGEGAGVTIGVMYSEKGVYPYVGGGLVSGPGGALTYSTSDPVPGWNVALQAGIGSGGQIGYSFGESGGWFSEWGMVTPGASITVFYVWEHLWPWKQPR
jgi:hypothetical protein